MGIGNIGNYNKYDVGSYRKVCRRLPSKTGLTLHELCRITDQMGYDMKRRVIAEDRGI